MSAKLVLDLSNEEYHKSPGISFSGLVQLQKSPAHYQAWLKEPREETPAMRFGTAVHMAVLEPDKFYSTYALSPRIDKRTKEGKAMAEAFEQMNQGKIALSEEDFVNIEGIRNSIARHNKASITLSIGKPEASILWTDKDTGVQCRIRPDFLRHDNIIVDLKTTFDASPDGFIGSLKTYKYHLQTAFYLYGLAQLTGEEKTDFIHLVVEKEAPYGVKLYTLDDDSIMQGMDEVRHLLHIYAKCLETDRWPGYDEEVENLRIPSWMFRSMK